MGLGEVTFYGLVGVIGGGAAAAVVWAIASRQLDRQFDTAAADVITRAETELTHTLDTEIPARVGAAIDQKLGDVGITPQTGQRIRAVLDFADRAGLIGLRGTRIR